MPRYRAHLTFGPWHAGDVFESDDEFHATLAEQGRILTIEDAGSPRQPRRAAAVKKQAQVSSPADTSSADEESQEEDDD